MRSARVLLAAPASGSGKTMLTCGILAALKKRGKNPVSFKCGPDYIDPMFQRTVIGIPAGTLDLFFSDESTLRRLYARHAAEGGISVIEGVMGYYDGLAAGTDAASSYRVAKALSSPTVLIINARGQSLSALAELSGFLKFRRDSGIRGVIFNQMSGHVFEALKQQTEALGVVPVGFVSRSDEMTIESRHLGLVTPDGIRDLEERIDRFSEKLEETLDLDALIRIAEEAPDMDPEPEPAREKLPASRIAVARDEAFNFLYRDNLELLESFGARLTFFSPLRDPALPDGTQGLILPGGYPELYAKELSGNASMRESIRNAVGKGLPCLAECGGFLYLHRTLEGTDGTPYPMCGVIAADAYKTGKLGRFGYVTLTAKSDTAFLKAGEPVKGHEFHYFESTDPGADLRAEKPGGGKAWDCAHATENLLAGFMHLFYESDPDLIRRFLERCLKGE